MSLEASSSVAAVHEGLFGGTSRVLVGRPPCLIYYVQIGTRDLCVQSTNLGGRGADADLVRRDLSMIDASNALERTHGT